MKLLGTVLIALIVLIQYPLWFGKGSWMRVWEVDRQIKAQHDKNAKLAVRNQVLDAEVRDLKQGLDAVEERARSELGMVKRDEVFFQVLNPGQSVPADKPARLSVR
jgi:cell division protein FtsB